MKKYLVYFDEICELPFITYRQNILRGIKEIHDFKRGTSVLKNILGQYSKVTIFMSTSAWLPANALLYHLHNLKNVENLFRYTYGDPEKADTYASKLRTWYARMYRLLLPHYTVSAICTSSGTFADFIFQDKIPGTIVKILSPYQKTKADKNAIIFPVVKKSHSPVRQKNKVFFFGDAGALLFEEFIDNPDETKRKVEAFFKHLKKVYCHEEIYYKPHPSDNGALLPGIQKNNITVYQSLDFAQEIFEAQSFEIKAVYTISSSSVQWSAFFGIPSYTLYRYLYNKSGQHRYNSIFLQLSETAKPFLKHISSLHEVGTIDSV